MPKVLEKCVKKLVKQGKTKSSAFAICTASLQKSGQLTEFRLSETVFSDNYTVNEEKAHWHKIKLDVENKNNRITIKGETLSTNFNVCNHYDNTVGDDIEKEPQEHDHNINLLLSANILWARGATKKGGEEDHIHEIYIHPAELLYLQNIKNLKEDSKITWLEESYKLEDYDGINLSTKDKINSKTKARNRGNVVFSANSLEVKDNKNHFPINSTKEARLALSSIGLFDITPPWYAGTLKELKSVMRRRVKTKYPTIQVMTSEKIHPRFFSKKV